MSDLTPPLAAPDPAPPAPSGHYRPKRQGLFTSFPYETVAAISATSAGIGLVMLLMEALLLPALIGEPPGVMLHLPVPFLSAPLGVGAALILAIAARGGWRVMRIPAIMMIAYWGLFAALWANL